MNNNKVLSLARRVRLELTFIGWNSYKVISNILIQTTTKKNKIKIFYANRIAIILSPCAHPVTGRDLLKTIMEKIISVN